MRIGRAIVILILSATPQFATEARGDLEARLEHKLLAPCCYRETLDRHSSEAAAFMRAEIRDMIASGRSEREIIDHYKAQYGARILSEPEGVAWWVGTLTPLVALLIGTGLVVALIRKWTRAQRLIPAAAQR